VLNGLVMYSSAPAEAATLLDVALGGQKIVGRCVLGCGGLSLTNLSPDITGMVQSRSTTPGSVCSCSPATVGTVRRARTATMSSRQRRLEQTPWWNCRSSAPELVLLD